MGRSAHKTAHEVGAEFYARLMRTAAYLGEHPSSAADAAIALGTSKMSVAAHLVKLKQIGYRVTASYAREGRRGPPSKIWTVKAPEPHQQ